MTNIKVWIERVKDAQGQLEALDDGAGEMDEGEMYCLLRDLIELCPIHKIKKAVSINRKGKRE